MGLFIGKTDVKQGTQTKSKAAECPFGYWSCPSAELEEYQCAGPQNGADYNSTDSQGYHLVQEGYGQNYSNPQEAWKWDAAGGDSCGGAPGQLLSSTQTEPIIDNPAPTEISESAQEPTPTIIPTPATAKVVSYELGSSQKICQLTGDTDRERNQPTWNQTFSRFGVEGTDLGISFEHAGKLFFLFGDTLGRSKFSGANSIAFSTDTNPENCLALQFLTGPDGNYLPAVIPGISTADYEVPSGGLSVNGNMYIFHSTGHTDDKVMGRSVLARSTDNGRSFENIADISSDKFINVSPSRSINFRVVDQPWGPWSPTQVLFDPQVDGGYCHFIHFSWENPICDYLSDPELVNEYGGEYAPYVISRFTTSNASETTIYFVMSTWNPYQVVLMKSTLKSEYTSGSNISPF